LGRWSVAAWRSAWATDLALMSGLAMAMAMAWRSAWATDLASRSERAARRSQRLRAGHRAHRRPRWPPPLRRCRAQGPPRRSRGVGRWGRRVRGRRSLARRGPAPGPSASRRGRPLFRSGPGGGRRCGSRVRGSGRTARERPSGRRGPAAADRAGAAARRHGSDGLRRRHRSPSADLPEARAAGRLDPRLAGYQQPRR
jgi:hypothetical protein